MPSVKSFKGDDDYQDQEKVLNHNVIKTLHCSISLITFSDIKVVVSLSYEISQHTNSSTWKDQWLRIHQVIDPAEFLAHNT